MSIAMRSVEWFAEFLRINAIRRVFGMLHVRRRELVVLLALALAYAFFEGFGIGLLLPVLQYAESGMPAIQQSAGAAWGIVIGTTEWLGIPLNLATLLTLAFVPILLRQVSFYYSAIYTAIVQNRASARLRTAAYVALVNADMAFITRRSTGEIISALTGQVDAAGAALAQCLRLIIVVALLSIYSLLLLLVSPVLTVMAVTAVTIMSLIAQVFVARSRETGIRLSLTVREAYTAFIERIGVLRLVKMLGQEEPERRATEEVSAALATANVNISKAQAQVEVVVDPGLMLGTFLALYVGIEYLSLSLADLSLFLFVLLRMNQKAKDFSTTRQQLSAYLESLLFVDRLTREARNERDIVGGSSSFQGMHDSLTFRDVSFSYGSAEGQVLPVLSHVDIEIPAGTTTAVVGRSGAGKSTLVELIPRLKDATRGEVLIDGVSIRQYELRSLRRHIGYMTQEAMLINASVYENLVYGLEREPDTEELWRALEDSSAGGFVRALPDGLRTLIGDRGARLSGGERQRLGLARVLLQNPDILILDEPTSALDSESENAIQRALERVHGSKTIVVVAHRLSTVQKADRILVIDSGRIVEAGTHQQLLEANGAYRRLFESQLI